MQAQSVDALAETTLAVPCVVRVAQVGLIEWGIPQQSWFGIRRGPEGCLEHFMRLITADDEEVVRFAARWGVLGFCEHSLPGIHHECPPKLVGRRRRGDPKDLVWYREKTDDWRLLAKRVRDLLVLAKGITKGEQVRKADWEGMMNGTPPGLDAVLSRDYPASSVVEVVLSSMLDDAGITPTVRWSSKASRFQLGLDLEGPYSGKSHIFSRAFPWPIGSLYQVIVLQLASAVTSGRLVHCARCGIAFDWEQAGYERFPRFDRSAFCGEWCRAEVRREQKAASKRSRDARKRRPIEGGQS
jgi:hypothetical protein